MLRGLLWRVLAALGLAVTFAGALVLAVYVHLQAAPLHRALASRVNDVLARVLVGKLVIDEIGPIGLGGLGGVAHVVAPDGETVIAVRGVRARADVVGLVRSLVRGDGGPITLHLAEVSVGSAEVVLDTDASGALAIAGAFEPLPSKEPPSGRGRGIDLAIERVTVEHVWAHGRPGGPSSVAVDADLDALAGQVRVAPPQVAVDVTRVAVTTRGMRLGASAANAQGALEAHLAIPAAHGGQVSLTADWKGAVAGIAESVHASLDGDAIDATVAVPSIAPDAIRALWQASPITETPSLSAEVHGTLARFDATAHVAMDGASVDLKGPITLAGGQAAHLTLDARGIDLEAVVPAAPPSKLAAKGTIEAKRDAAGALSATVQVEFEGGTIATEPVPSAAVRATVEQSEKDGLRADATITAREPGAPTILSVHAVQPSGRQLAVSFATATHAPRLEAIPRLRQSVQGKTLLKTHGLIDFEKGSLAAKVEAEVDRFGQGAAVSVEHASIDLDVSGSLKSPQIDANIHGRALDVVGYRFSHLVVEAHGQAKRMHIVLHLRAEADGSDARLAPDVEAECDLELTGPPAVKNFVVRLARAGDRLEARAGAVRVSAGEIDVEGVTTEGLGAPLTASLRMTPTALRVNASARGLDVAALARLLRIEERFQGCRLALAVDASLRRDGAEGHASADLSACSFENVKDTTAHLDATMRERTITGEAHFDVPGVGSIDFRAKSIRLGGTAPVVASWRKAWGDVKFEGHADLAKAVGLLPHDAIPLDDARGNVSFSGRLERDTMDDMTPTFDLSLQTQGLSLVGVSRRVTGANGSASIEPPSWRLQGIDVGFDTHVDGNSGFAEVSARANDEKGALASIDLKSATVPFAELIAEPSKSLSLLEATQMSARLAIPKRSLESLPPAIAPRGARGDLEGELTVTGSALKPIADMRLTLGQARARAAGLAMPTTFELAAHYAAAHLDATLAGVVRGARVLDATATADADVADFLAGNPSSAKPWTASANAHLDTMPVEALAALADHQVHGRLSGDVSLEGLHTDAKAKVSLTLDDLKVGDVAYKSGKIDGSLDDAAFDVTARLDQDDGFLQARAHAGAHWGKALVPALDGSKNLDCALTASRFRAALVLPFVDNVFTELDARMDANATVALDAKTRTARVAGTVSVDSGRFELASIGGEFHDATMKITFTPDGVVRVENVKAQGMSGRIEGAATARLENLSLVAANASVLIPSSSPFLLTVEGSQVGTIEGQLSITEKAQATSTDVTVDVRRLHAELPLTSSRDVQVLGDIDGVKIGTQTAKGFVPERLDAPRVQSTPPSDKTLNVAINLGEDVQVKRGGTLKVALDGHPSLAIGNEVRASGQIRLLNGTIDVQGKAFDVERGTVTFVGDDPSNPQVVVTASWTAPDGTRVYADFVGPLKTGKVTLRSEPSLPKNEILALILFGTPDGLTPSSQTSSSNTQTTAGAGVAGSAAAQPLNQALESYGLGGVTTRVDTSTANPRPEVEVQIARDISLQVAYVIGTPPPGTNPDATLFTLNWRFIRQWSLETTIGSSGTSILDLIWQYRY